MNQAVRLSRGEHCGCCFCLCSVITETFSKCLTKISVQNVGLNICHQLGKKCRMESQNDMKDSDNDINLKELAKMQKHSRKAEDKSNGVVDTSVDMSEEEEE